MTLFANILNNPLDPRAKSDTRLMAMVVSFLSMLGQEAETGGVHRMLGVCAEFERIGKSVIEKAEKEQSSRRKRKNNPDASKPIASTASTVHSDSATAGRSHPHTNDGASTTRPAPLPTGSKAPDGSSLSPTNGQEQLLGYSPIDGSLNGVSPSMSSTNGGGGGWPQEYSMHQNGEMEQFNDLFGFSGGESPGGLPYPAGFQPPMLPNDIFSLSMNLDWDWAELSCGAYPTVENGNFDQERQ